MPVNVEQTAAFAALSKSFTSSFDAREQLGNALREHLDVTPRDSFWMSDDGIDDVLGPVVIYALARDAYDGNGGGIAKGVATDSFFRATYERTADGYTFGEPVNVRRRTDYVRDSGSDECCDATEDEAEVPAWLATALAMASKLTKGAGHRYIRRVPKSGGGYRYFYKVSGGAGLGHADEMKVGSKFRVTNGGQDGHFEILGKNENGTLRIKHDESGHESTISPLALRAMLHSEHAQSLTAHREKLASDIKATDDPKAKARLLAEAGKYEHTRDLAGGESEADERARISAKGRENRERLGLDPAYTKLHNWSFDQSSHSSRVTGTAARTMNVGDREYQLVPQPRPGKPPGFVANFSMPGRAGSLDAKGNRTATPHVFDTQAEAHAAVVAHEKDIASKPKAAAAEKKPEPVVESADPDNVREAKKRTEDSIGAAYGTTSGSVYTWDGSSMDLSFSPRTTKTQMSERVERVLLKLGDTPDVRAGVKAVLDAHHKQSGGTVYHGDQKVAWSADDVMPKAADKPAKPQGDEKKPAPKPISKVDIDRVSGALDGYGLIMGNGTGRKADVPEGKEHEAAAWYFDHLAQIRDDYHQKEKDTADHYANGPVGIRSPEMVDRFTRLAVESKKKAETYRKHAARMRGPEGPALVAAVKAAKSTRKSMSSITDPERDLAKSLAASHRAAAERQPDAGARAAHEAAAQACDAAAEADGTTDYRKAIGAAGRIGGLVKAWSNIPDAQRPPFDDFRKSMTQAPPAARLGAIGFRPSNGTGDALGGLSKAVAAARPVVEQPTPVEPEASTYSAQVGAVNGLRKSMGAFYDRVCAGATPARLDIRFPPEAPLAKSGGPFIGPHGGKWADAAHTIPWKEPAPGGLSVGQVAQIHANANMPADHKLAAAYHAQMARYAPDDKTKSLHIEAAKAHTDAHKAKGADGYDDKARVATKASNVADQRTAAVRSAPPEAKV